jgi:hypothetical protein
MADGDLSSHYVLAPGAQSLSRVSDEDLDYLLKQHEATQGAMQVLSDEDLDFWLKNYEAPEGNVDDNNLPQVNPPPPSLTAGEEAAGAARELAGGAAFEFGDEAEAAIRAPFSDKSYGDLLKDIRLQRAKYNEAHPFMGPALNVAGGIGAMFVPGAGAVGKGVQGLTGISRMTSPLARTASSAALAGGVSGFGSGEDMGSRVANTMIGAGLGAGLGAGVYGAGKGLQWAKDVVTARGAQGEEEAARNAAEIMSRRLQESGLSPEQAAQLWEMEQRYGIPSVLGTTTPELARLTENVVNMPSGERADLATRLFTQQAGAPARVQGQIKTAIPTPDYFASEERILNTLRTNAERNYGAGWKDVEIRDPRIMKVLDSPDIRSAYMDAVGNARRRQEQAILEGEDPSQFKMRELFDPILNEEGALVGLSPTGKVVPDMGTLNQVKIALDQKINALYASGEGGKATSLRGIRDAFVKRLDDIGPAEFKAARQQYKGDIEIKEALEQGRKAGTLRWQEVGKLMKDYSPGEQQAFKTGLVQNFMQRFENTGNSRNFAKDILKGNDINKFKAVMDPAEFQVFEAALKRESELFDTISRTTRGSATFGRLAEKSDIDEQIAAGRVENAVDLLVNPSPGNILRKTLQAVAGMRNANVSRATYTQLARMLKAGTPDEIDTVLRQLEEAAPRQQTLDKAFEGRATKVGTAAASTISPPPEDTRGQLQPTTEVVIPSLDEGEVSGLSAMPSPGPQTSGGGPGSTSISDALNSIMPDWEGMAADGTLMGPQGMIDPQSLAKALGISIEALQTIASGGR